MGYKKKVATDMYQVTTNNIVKAIESGSANGKFVCPWHRGETITFGVNFLPRNPVTNYTFTGINQISLWAAAQMFGFKSNCWARYDQWKRIDGQVKRNSAHFKIIRVWTSEEEAPVLEGEPKKRGRSGIYPNCVFAAEQVDGFEYEFVPTMNECDRKIHLDGFISGLGVDFRIADEAFYNKREHFVGMPAFMKFSNWQTYYSVFFHELTHWTMGPLKRTYQGCVFETEREKYAFEELVAELGAAFLCAQHEIHNDQRDDHAGYIAGWLQAMKGDNSYIFKASKYAQEAVNYINSLAQ